MTLFSAGNVLGQNNHVATIIDADGSQASVADVEEHGVAEVDSLALVAYYESTNGDQWLEAARGGWLVDPVVTWESIDEVSNVGTDEEPEWRVTRLDFDGHRNTMTIPGPIPPEIANMEHLERFRKRENLLSGPFPPEMGNMEHLERLRTRSNVMSGPTPWEELSQAPNLERFQYRSNYFDGEIPDAICDFPRLERLMTSDQFYEGTFPECIDQVETLTRFRIEESLHTGPLPDLGNMENLTRYIVANNDWDPGPVPEWLNNPNIQETMQRISLEFTNREGEIPAWIANLGQLSRLRIGGYTDDLSGQLPNLEFLDNLNRITIYSGDWDDEQIPEWLGRVPNLERLNLRGTDFTGPIPDNIADLPIERLVLYDAGELTGGLPIALQNAASLTHLQITDIPSLEIGKIPSWLGELGNLSSLRLENTGLSGDIPAALENLEALSDFRVSENPDLTGDIPDWFQDRSLSTLDLSHTGLDVDEIPAWLADQQSMSNLALGGLGIEGEIPQWMGDNIHYQINLSVLALDDNNLTGQIPANFGNLVDLDSLNLANNNLSGPIPPQVGNAGQPTTALNLLSAVILSGNEELEGPIPTGFTEGDVYNAIRVFEYENTNLETPQEVEDWLDEIPAKAYLTYPPSYTSVVTNDLVSAEDPGDQQSPYVFHLSQNYPNPFNPTTTISYEIPVDAEVSLRVYNVLGQHVATLINEHQSAGSHEVSFDASNLASGSYIYRLEAGEMTQNRTMMFIK